MFEIDEKACIGCGQCVRVCPFTCLGMGEDGKAKRLRKRCIECMHCAAICPKKAITVDGRDGYAATAYEAISDATRHEIKKLLLQRRSYRHFLPHKVDRKLLEEALSYTAWAPSAKNEHPVHWLVIEDEAVKEEIMATITEHIRATGEAKEVVQEMDAHDNNVVLGKNATLLLTHCRDKSVMPWHDTAIALTTLELFLQANGVGTCWAGYLLRFMNALPKLKARFLPEGHSYYGAMLLGYPEGEAYRRIPARYAEVPVRWQ